MANFSNYYESGVLNYLFRTNTNNFVRPPALAVALCANIPAKTQTGTTIPEVANANGYARVFLGAPLNALFTECDTTNPAASGNISNVSAITFPAAAGGDWGWVSGVAITDSGVYGAGHLICWAALATPREIKSTDQYSFNIGTFTLYLG